VKGRCIGHSDSVRSLHATSSYLFSGSCDETIKVWSLENLRRVRKFKNSALYSKYAGVLCLDEDDSNLYSGHADGVIRIWSIHSFLHLGDLKGHLYDVYCIKISAKKLYSCSHDKTIIVWNLTKRTQLRVLSGHELAVRCLLLTNDFIKKVGKKCLKTIEFYN
jgi:WD40 repeat protein